MSGGKTLAFPMLLIALGVGWLLTTLGIVPQIDWAWTLGVAIVGILTFVLGGFDKVTFAIGSFFLIASGLSILRQMGRMSVNLEIPILVIVAGILLTIARMNFIPAPTWLVESPEKPRAKK